MKRKKALRIVATTMGLTMAVGLACGCLAGCGGGADALILGTDLPDGVFNPFFYTSGTDGDIVGQTMIGMISTDKDGKIVAGPDEPCVAYDYSVVTTGDSQHSNEVEGIDSTYYTDYYFAIKDNIVFSDGTPLTKNDVLFNIYMYLDPAYTGSATMYSVDIQGLQAYRTQTNKYSEQSQFESRLEQEVAARVDALRNWANDKIEGNYAGLGDQEKADIAKVEELFKEEISTDWNTAMSSDLKDYEKYVDKDGNKLITDYWQIFMYSYGLLKLTTEKETDPQTGEITKKWYTPEYDYDKDTATDKDTLTSFVFSYMLGGKEQASSAYKGHLYDVITYYATANTFHQYLRGEAIKTLIGDALKVRTISGITMESMSALPTADGGSRDLGKTYDVLHIRINGEDPKAIQNFGFTVAPLHYYSSHANEFSLEKDHEYFGVEFGDSDFMDSVRYIQVPLGAGPYRASTADGNPPADLNALKNSKSDFFSDNIVYLESNENFMLGAPKIKKLCYKVINTSVLYESVKTGEINFASPSATNEMIENLSGADSADLDYTSTDNLGYGYIGINASYVQDLNIRKAIMSAMNTSLCIDYYGSDDLASAIYRPMSTVLKDYYPTNATSYYPYDETGETSKTYAQRAGYTPDTDGFLKNSNGDRLKFTFTIAGDSEDHPAYATMVKAAEILNDVGFDVTVTRDSTALSKLAAGRLEVWAAAWSSSSDPDMYQVYHKDSSATSILAWGFPWIESANDEANSTVRDQKAILDELADRIMDGRETTDVAERKNAYSVSTGDKLSEGGSLQNLCALDLVMELAVELPTYQRKALYVYPRGLFDDATLALFAESTAFQSPLNRIWEVNFA